MKGDKKVIGYLNRIHANELIAINQCFPQAKMHASLAHHELAEQVRKESIDAIGILNREQSRMSRPALDNRHCVALNRTNHWRVHAAIRQKV